MEGKFCILAGQCPFKLEKYTDRNYFSERMVPSKVKINVGHTHKQGFWYFLGGNSSKNFYDYLRQFYLPVLHCLLDNYNYLLFLFFHGKTVSSDLSRKLGLVLKKVKKVLFIFNP